MASVHQKQPVPKVAVSVFSITVLIDELMTWAVFPELHATIVLMAETEKSSFKNMWLRWSTNLAQFGRKQKTAAAF